MADRDFLAEYESFEEVLDGCASRISEEGICLPIEKAPEVGSEVRFEVRIRNSFSVLRGEGRILGVDERGAYLSYVYLDQPSLKLLPKIVEHYRRHGVPLLELPEEPPAVAETPPPAAEALGLTEETEPDERATGPVETVPETEVEAVDAVGLTLDDLEAEFRVDGTVAEPPPEPDENEPPAARLLDARELLAKVQAGKSAAKPIEPDDVESAAEEGGSTGEDLQDLESAVDLDPEPFDEVVDLEAPIVEPVEEVATASTDIHLDSLFGKSTDGEVEPVDPRPTEEAVNPPAEGVLSVDAGLPWLPDEPEPTSRKGLWVIVAMILLGAILGALFYYFVFRPRSTEGLRPRESPTESPAAQSTAAPPTSAPQVTAADTMREPQPASVEGAAEPPPSAGGPAEEASPAAVAEVVSGVDRITWELESGQTVITFWGDGRFDDGQVDDFRVDDGAPREVVRIRGIRRPFPQQRIELGTDHVRQLRIGFHQDADGAALHFVADLTDPAVRLSRTEAAGEQLRAYFSSAG